MGDMGTLLDEFGWNRIVLGTAPLGLSYGRHRGRATLEEREVDAILSVAWSMGIRVFDTAEAYGTAAARLSDWLHDQDRLYEAKVVTKISVQAVTDIGQVQAACGRFFGAASITLLSHGALATREFAHFKSMAASCGAEAGQSIYTIAEAQEAAAGGATRVQAPVNVLDLRQLSASQKSGIPLDARSVYLQGVLLDQPEVAERRVPGAGMIAQAVQTAAKQAGLTAATALLAGVLAQVGPRDRIVIGIDAPDQFAEIAAAFEVQLDTINGFLESIVVTRNSASLTRNLLDPRTWS